MQSRPTHRRGSSLFRNVGWLAVIALVGAALFATPGVASAHTPSVTLTCQNGLKVQLSAYNNTHTNTVDVSIDGVAVTGSPFSFGTSFNQSWP